MGREGSEHCTPPTKGPGRGKKLHAPDPLQIRLLLLQTLNLPQPVGLGSPALQEQLRRERSHGWPSTQPKPRLHEVWSPRPAAADPRRWRTANALRVHGDRKEAERQSHACFRVRGLQLPAALAPHACTLLVPHYGRSIDRSFTFAGVRLQGHPDLSYLRETTPEGPALAAHPSGTGWEKSRIQKNLFLLMGN